MLSIKDTIQRLGKTVRQIELLNKVLPIKSDEKKLNSPNIIKRPNLPINQKSIMKNSLRLENYQIQRYRDFLQPLNIPNLKIFNDDLPKFDDLTSKINWKIKNYNSSKRQYNHFLLDRILFERMMDLLIKITPNKLKYVNRSKTLNHILKQQQEEENSMKFNVPTNEFHEIPKIPYPLTVNTFQKYIYQLTHTNYYYRNSSSLKSGIIPDILLYTHKLTNSQFKPYRSVTTYNYLIRYFGYNKNQSSFARELLLVMSKDDLKPNIDTINNLLKSCQIHSHIRTISNTYQIILKYLKLCQSLQIEINLTTYVRIYDCINNIFLKEIFLNKIQSIELPISKSLLLRIIDDFALTTKNTGELIEFIETDLARPNWNQENVIFNKVIHHRGLNIQSKQDMLNLWIFINTKLDNFDIYTLKSLLESLKMNEYLLEKFYTMMIVYLQSNITSINNNVRIYQFLVNQFLQEISDEDLIKSSFILRGLFYEMTEKLNLPKEKIQYSNNKSSLPENYAIIKRILGNNNDRNNRRIIEIEAKINHSKITPLHQELNNRELQTWTNFIDKLRNQPMEILPIKRIYELLDLKLNITIENIPASTISCFQKIVKSKTSYTRNRARIYKVTEGIDEYTVRQMKERGLIEM